MNKNLVVIKNEINELVENDFELYSNISTYIFNNPELAFNEYRAKKILISQLKNSGFEIEEGVGGLETAF